MMEMGAAPEEIARVRRRDRMCQGITEEQEKEAERAISKKEEICGVTIVRMAHSKTATVADRLFEKDKQQNLLILSDDGEANYFGDGKLCKMLQGNVIGEQPPVGCQTRPSLFMTISAGGTAEPAWAMKTAMLSGEAIPTMKKC